MIEAIILVLAVNAAITIAVRSAMRKKNIEPKTGETMFVVLGLLFGWLLFILAFVSAVLQICREARNP
jgi:apolipoprotein N-acyltransferase